MLAGIKRKYPQVDIEEVLKGAQDRWEYPEGMLNIKFGFGGAKAGRSLVKSAVALAVSCGVPANNCECAKRYLPDQDGEACFGYYFSRALVKNRPTDKVFHCVAVRGEKAGKRVLAYVEYYGVLRTVMCLSENYEGADFATCYALDPVLGKELSLEVDLALPPEEILASYNYERYPTAEVIAAFDRILPLALNSSWDKEQERASARAVKEAFKQLGLKEGETLTPEHIAKFSRLAAENLLPFLLHCRNRPKKPPSE